MSDFSSEDGQASVDSIFEYSAPESSISGRSSEDDNSESASNGPH